MHRGRGLLGLFVVALPLLAACRLSIPVRIAQQLPARGGQVTEAIVGRPASLNPVFAAEDDARDIDTLIYQGLTTIGADQQPKPLLARSWQLSSDGLTYTFSLRSDVRWADGEAFTAGDVLFTFGLLSSPDYQGAAGTFWRDVKVSAAGPDTVKFTLKAPSAGFPAALKIGILPRHVFPDASPAAVAADPHSSGQAFGTGPFQVASISDDRRTVTLRRNRYAKPAPYLDRFVFRSYATFADALDAVAQQQADTLGGLLPRQVEDLAKRPDLVVRHIRSFTFTAVLLNTDAGSLFADPAIRTALQRAVDRGAIVDSILADRAVPALGPIPPSNWAYVKPPGDTGFNPDAAEAGLDKAGWSKDPGTGLRAKRGVPLRVTLDTADAYPYLQVAEMVSGQLRRVGMQVDVQPVSASELVGRYLVGHRFQMALAAFDNGPDPDQWALWHSGQDGDSLNFAGDLPHQALIDKDLEDGRAGRTKDSRARAYADFQVLMWQAAPALFLYQPDYLYVVATRVHGVKTNDVIEPADRFQYVSGWFTATRTT